MQWLEQKYINLLSGSLERFRQKSSSLYNFRCPVCNDSAVNKSKARGFIYLRSGKYFFFCHNCGASKSFTSFLKEQDRLLYDSFLVEKLTFDTNEPVQQYKPRSILSNEFLKHLTKVSSLPADHPCKKYLIARQIPTDVHHQLFFTNDFRKWTNSIIPNKFSNTDRESRLVLPMFNRENIMFGYTGRAIDSSNEVRYILIITDETQPKLYGINRVNVNEKYYVFEGPIDSLFIQNSLAIMGSHFGRELDLLCAPKDNAVIVYDNQPHNKDVVKNIAKAIRMGYNVCIWPAWVKEKDVNEMVLSRVKNKNVIETEKVKTAAKAVQTIIDDHTFSGLNAELELQMWKKT